MRAARVFAFFLLSTGALAFCSLRVERPFRPAPQSQSDVVQALRSSTSAPEPTCFVLLDAGLKACSTQVKTASIPDESGSSPFRSMAQKIAFLKANAAKPNPDPKPVELTEAEVNAYFAEGGVKLPKGVSQVHLSSRPGLIDGHARVDFEQIMQGKGPSNPLYSMFSGTHEIHAQGQASGAHGSGTIRVQSVELDGVQLPQFAVDWFVQHYLKSKYPNVGSTSTFKLPLRIESAVVETGKVSLVQR